VAASQSTDKPSQAALGAVSKVLQEMNDLHVATPNIQAARAAPATAGQRAGRLRVVMALASALKKHSLRLAPLRLRELGRDDDQAKVDHEKRADLDKNTAQNNGCRHYTGRLVLVR